MKQHKILKKFIIGLSKGYSDSLIVVSKAGLGKTETTLNTIKELGYTEGKHYIYLNNYLTSKALVRELEAVNELEKPKLLILDDVEDTLNNLRSVGVLKGALWGTITGERKVCWITDRERIEFNFEGRIIFLLNKLDKKNPIVQALRDRGFYYELEMSNKEIMSLMEKRSEKKYYNIPQIQRKKIVEYLRKVGGTSSGVSLRLLPKAYNCFLLSPHHWKSLVKTLIV